MNARDWTVLVVERNKFEGQIMVDLLRNAGVHKVRLEQSQEVAIGLLATYNANVVIASYEMMPLDGAAWTKAYRRNKKLPGRKAAIFITSGAFSRLMAEQCRHAGCNALIGKPISGKVLLNTINKVLTQPREFIDTENGYVGPCRRAGIVTAGAPSKRRRADKSAEGATVTIQDAVNTLRSAALAIADDPLDIQPLEAELRNVQAYAVNAGDGPLMRACAVFSLQLTSIRSLRPEVVKASLMVCVDGVAELVALGQHEVSRREQIAEDLRMAAGKATLKRVA